MEGITSNLIVVTFEEKGLGVMAGTHKIEEAISFPFLTFLCC